MVAVRNAYEIYVNSKGNYKACGCGGLLLAWVIILIRKEMKRWCFVILIRKEITNNIMVFVINLQFYLY